MCELTRSRLRPTRHAYYSPLLVLDLRLDVVDGVARLDLKRDGLTSKRLDEDLHTTTETKDEVERRLLLDVVVGDCEGGRDGCVSADVCSS